MLSVFLFLLLIFQLGFCCSCCFVCFFVGFLFVSFSFFFLVSLWVFLVGWFLFFFSCVCFWFLSWALVFISDAHGPRETLCLRLYHILVTALPLSLPSTRALIIDPYSDLTAFLSLSPNSPRAEGTGFRFIHVHLCSHTTLGECSAEAGPASPKRKQRKGVTKCGVASSFTFSEMLPIMSPMKSKEVLRSPSCVILYLSSHRSRAGRGRLWVLFFYSVYILCQRLHSLWPSVMRRRVISNFMGGNLWSLPSLLCMVLIY